MRKICKTYKIGFRWRSVKFFYKTEWCQFIKCTDGEKATHRSPESILLSERKSWVSELCTSVRKKVPFLWVGTQPHTRAHSLVSRAQDGVHLISPSASALGQQTVGTTILSYSEGILDVSHDLVLFHVEQLWIYLKDKETAFKHHPSHWPLCRKCCLGTTTSQ